MHVISRNLSSKCIDGAVVCEYTLSGQVDDELVELLKKNQDFSETQFGGLRIFTCKNEWLSVKGMTGDTILYITCQKSDVRRIEEYILNLLQSHQGL